LPIMLLLYYIISELFVVLKNLNFSHKFNWR